MTFLMVECVGKEDILIGVGSWVFPQQHPQEKKEGAVRVPILKTTENIGYLTNSLVLFRIMTIGLLLTNGCFGVSSLSFAIV